MTYRSRTIGALACALAAGVAAAASAQPPKPFETPSVHGFNVALVLGDLQGTSSPDSLPIGAKKALADIRDFLPYKSYRLLDTQWILCCGSSKAGIGVSGRLRGISDARGSDEQVYSFTVTVLNVSGSQLSVRFLMSDGAPSALKKLAGSDNAPADKELQRVEEALRAAGSTKGAVIDSTFSMEIGETVVIGTSSLKGDKALVAVLTAAKRPGHSSTTNGDKR